MRAGPQPPENVRSCAARPSARCGRTRPLHSTQAPTGTWRSGAARPQEAQRRGLSRPPAGQRLERGSRIPGFSPGGGGAPSAVPRHRGTSTGRGDGACGPRGHLPRGCMDTLQDIFGSYTSPSRTKSAAGSPSRASRGPGSPSVRRGPRRRRYWRRVPALTQHRRRAHPCSGKSYASMSYGRRPSASWGRKRLRWWSGRKGAALRSAPRPAAGAGSRAWRQVPAPRIFRDVTEPGPQVPGARVHDDGVQGQAALRGAQSLPRPARRHGRRPARASTESAQLCVISSVAGR